ncbi:MAG: hypothetical protein WCO06_06780 [Candidatus Roizmanbacteria bacterium]
MTEYFGTALLNPLDLLKNNFIFLQTIFVESMKSFEKMQRDFVTISYLIFELFLYCYSLVFIIKEKDITKKIIYIILISFLIGRSKDPFHISPFIALALLQLFLHGVDFKSSNVYRAFIGTIIVYASVLYFVSLPSDKFNYPNYQTNYEDRYVRDYTSPGDTILTYPIHINTYITNHRNPGSFYYFLLPWVVEIPGSEDKIIDDIKKNNVKLVYIEPQTIIWDKYKVNTYTQKVHKYLIENYDAIDSTQSAFARIYLRKH